MRAPAPAALLAALAPAVVLGCDPGGFFPFGPAKWLAVTALVPAGAALLLRRRPVRVAVRPTVAVTAVAVAMALAAVVGEDPLYAWIGTPERHLGVLAWILIALAFVAGQSMTDDADRRWVLGGVVVAGLGLGAAAIAEAVGAWPSLLDAGERLGATFGSPAYLGAGTALLLPALLGLAVDETWPHRSRGVAAVGAATLVVAGIGSGARAAWVGLLAAAVVTAVAQRRRLPGRRTLLVGALVALPAIGVLAVVTPAGDRATSLFDDDAAGGQGRLDEWRVAVAVLAEHPVTGVGPEGYRVTAAEGVDRAYEREHGRDPLPDRAHSAPLDIALSGGPLALVAWAGALVLLARHLRRALVGDRPWLVGIAAGLLAYIGGELLLFPLAELEPVAALLAGIVVAATAADGELRARVAPRPALVALGVVAAAAVGAGGLDLVADREADLAAEALRRFEPAAAVAHAERAIDLRPDILRNHLLLAATLEADQQGVVAAIAAVDDALDLSPRDPIALRRRAELLVVRADATLVPAHIDTARDELAALLDDDPNNSVLWILAGVVARLDGDVAGARDAWTRASRLDPGDPTPVLARIQLEIEQLLLRIAAEDGTP